MFQLIVVAKCAGLKFCLIGPGTVMNVIDASENLIIIAFGSEGALVN